MIKNLIAPIQAWLLSQGRCVGCGEDLNHGKKATVKGQTTITCRCGRIFVYNSAKNSYRRALFDEI